MKVKSLSHVQLLATPWTAAYQAPPSMGFSRQEYWSGVPSPSPRQREGGSKGTGYPRLGIEDSYFLVHFLSHPVSTYHGLLNSQLSTVLDAVIGKLWFLSPWGFLSWGNSSDIRYYIHAGCCGGPEEEGIARQVYWGLPGVVGGG